MQITDQTRTEFLEMFPEFKDDLVRDIMVALNESDSVNPDTLPAYQYTQYRPNVKARALFLYAAHWLYIQATNDGDAVNVIVAKSINDESATYAQPTSSNPLNSTKYGQQYSLLVKPYVSCIAYG